MNTDDQKPTTDHKLYDTECRPESQKPTTTLSPIHIIIPRTPSKGPLKFTDLFGRDLVTLGYSFKELAYFAKVPNESYVIFTFLHFRKADGDKERTYFDLQFGQQADGTRLMDGDVDLFEALPIEKFELLPLTHDGRVYFRITIKLMPEDTVEIA